MQIGKVCNYKYCRRSIISSRVVCYVTCRGKAQICWLVFVLVLESVHSIAVEYISRLQIHITITKYQGEVTQILCSRNTHHLCFYDCTIFTHTCIQIIVQDWYCTQQLLISREFPELVALIHTDRNVIRLSNFYNLIM